MTFNGKNDIIFTKVLKKCEKLRKESVIMQTKSKKILAIMLVIMFVITNLSTQPMSVEAATKKPTTIKLNAT